MSEPQIDPIRNVAKRTQEVAKDQGLKLLNFSVTPSLDDSPDTVTLVFEYDPDKVNEPELIIQQANKELVDAMEEERKKEVERRRLKAREELDDLEKRMGGRQGFLDDFKDDDD